MGGGVESGRVDSSLRKVGRGLREDDDEVSRKVWAIGKEEAEGVGVGVGVGVGGGKVGRGGLFVDEKVEELEKQDQLKRGRTTVGKRGEER